MNAVDDGSRYVYSPGGLSTTAHVIHLVMTLFTCGLWFPLWAAHVILTPSQRVSVIVPGGQPRPLPRREAVRLAPTDRAKDARRQWLIVGAVAGPLLGAAIIGWTLTALGGR